MTTEINKQVTQLSAHVATFAAKHGTTVVTSFQSESELVLEWLSFVGTSQRTGTADSLLSGASSSVCEAAACLSLGLVRPALFSLRTQIDLLFAWLYFKDHPVEWRTVNDFGEGYKLKRELLDYLADHFKGFAIRYAALKEVATRTVEDPYRLLSGHIHAQSVPALPVATGLSDVIQDKATCIECTLLARQVNEYVGDVLLSVYATKWAALPSAITTAADVRLKTKIASKRKFFGTI